MTIETNGLTCTTQLCMTGWEAKWFREESNSLCLMGAARKLEEWFLQRHTIVHFERPANVVNCHYYTWQGTALTCESQRTVVARAWAGHGCGSIELKIMMEKDPSRSTWIEEVQEFWNELMAMVE